MLEKQGKIRIKDIAEKTGVSIGTIDRVLHNRGNVKEETRTKIMAVINEWEYTPNLSAKSLATKKTYQFAVIIPYTGETNSYWNKPMEGIMQGAAEIEDYNSTVEIFTFDAFNKDSFERACEKSLESDLAGVVFQPLFEDESIAFTKKLDERNIPYVYIDMNLEKGNKLSYFGQNAEQSGRVAAKLFNKASFQEKSKILIAKCNYKGVISDHLEKRAKGFVTFMENELNMKLEIISVNIDLFEKNEPDASLSKVIEENPDIKGVFVPNSRVFHVATFFAENKRTDLMILGYDLIDRNVDYLNEGVIDYLISQKSEEQGYQSVKSLFNHVVAKRDVKKMNYSSIDIIIKENIEFYNK